MPFEYHIFIQIQHSELGIVVINIVIGMRLVRAVRGQIVLYRHLTIIPLVISEKNTYI